MQARVAGGARPDRRVDTADGGYQGGVVKEGSFAWPTSFPTTRARIGLQTEPGADAVEAMIQACGSCHNDVLDQSISRARFNINLWSGSPDAIAAALDRVERAPDAPGVMPPPEARQLDRQGRQRLLEYLRGDPLTRQPDARLVHAAELGMAGGAANGSHP